MARPTKLTPETQTKYLNGLKLGLTKELAASYAGVGERPIYDWIARGNAEPESIYSQFSQAVKEAEGQCAAVCMGRIQRAAEEGSWQAASWIMERRFGYRRDSLISLSTETADDTELTVVDPNAADGRALVIEHVSKLPEDLILAALNLKTAGDAK